jgi:L-alanine-DL-glutamate epimerase-like enolase superfamily enzyme
MRASAGFGEVEQYKPYLKPFILHFRDALIGEDSTNVERVMLRIRQRGAFKPWGGAVSAIEMALWDVTGNAPLAQHEAADRSGSYRS